VLDTGKGETEESCDQQGDEGTPGKLAEREGNNHGKGIARLLMALINQFNDLINQIVTLYIFKA
jgi:hypothetical protein